MGPKLPYRLSGKMTKLWNMVPGHAAGRMGRLGVGGSDPGWGQIAKPWEVFSEKGEQSHRVQCGCAHGSTDDTESLSAFNQVFPSAHLQCGGEN